MRFTDKFRDTIAMSNDSFIIIAMDKNQRVQRKKQQRESTSNNFILVTHSMAIKPLDINPRFNYVVPVITIKSPITYIDQAIVSVDGMSDFENISTVEDVIAYITSDSTVNVPVTPDYSDKRVNTYYDVVRICYGLIQQRQFFSRVDTEFQFLDKASMDTVHNLIGNLHSNFTHAGWYAKSRTVQKKEVTQWFGEKNKVQICFLPTSKEDKTTNLGCATVFLEILENTVVINIQR